LGRSQDLVQDPRELLASAGVRIYSREMSRERDELRRPVDELPEDQVAAVLQELRQHALAASDRPWPLFSFGSVKGSTTQATRVDDLLGEGFGR
jgi:hypothetical protein